MRARSLKPGFFKNEDLAALGAEAMIIYAGLWTLADREGRIEDRPRRIHAEIAPYWHGVNIDKILSELSENSFILRYEIDGKRFIAIPAWGKHQNPHHMEAPSVIPPPPGKGNRYNHTPVTKAQRLRIFDRDGHLCVVCGASDQLSIDHIQPVSLGGTSEDDNLRTLCIQCNTKKGGRPNDQSSDRTRIDDDSTTGRHGIVKNGSCPPSSLTPSSLTPDSIDKTSCPISSDVAEAEAALAAEPKLEAVEETWRSRQPQWRREAFARFWRGVWAKIGKGVAERQFYAKAKTPELAERIIAASVRDGPRLLTEASRGDRTPLHPATYLSQERYEDAAPSLLDQHQVCRPMM